MLSCMVFQKFHMPVLAHMVAYMPIKMSFLDSFKWGKHGNISCKHITYGS